MMYIKKLLYILLVLCSIFVILFLVQRSNAMEQEDNFWSNYKKWFEWKKLQKLSEEQREVILYIQKSNLLFEKADNTWETSQKQVNLPDPKKALHTVDVCLKEFSNLKPPLPLGKYYENSLKILNIIRNYHTKRLTVKDMRGLDTIAREAIPYESLQYSEYFNALRKVGLFDNIEKEMADLGLISAQGTKNFYNYYQEVNIGVTPKCPKCLSNMRRVPITYGKIEEDKIYINGRIVSLPGGDQDYLGKPKFGYVCDKDNMWYEEYPSQHKDKVIIRNWGWGLYTCKHKKNGDVYKGDRSQHKNR